jgi:hypothetical protein
MSRVSEIPSTLVNGNCLNSECSTRSTCALYSKPTDPDVILNYPAIPMLQCPLFEFKSPPTPRSTTPVFESF